MEIIHVYSRTDEREEKYGCKYWDKMKNIEFHKLIDNKMRCGKIKMNWKRKESAVIRWENLILARSVIYIDKQQLFVLIYRTDEVTKCKDNMLRITKEYYANR